MNRSCLTLLSVGMALVTTAVAAHPLAKHEGQRHLLGIHRFDPTVQPTEDWGTYCVTELAPIFREAVAMNISAGLSPAPHPMAKLAQGRDLTPVSDTTEPQPPSVASAPSQKIIVHVIYGFTANQLYGDKALETVQGMQAQATDKTMFKGVKFYADDAFVSLGMDMQWPGYVDPQTYKGLFMYESTEAFIEAMKPWWNADFSIHVHSNGSGGNQITLDALAALQEQKPRFDHRFTFEHFGISTVAQGRRVKALGAVISTNPYYVYERADLTAAQIGTDRASLAARMRSLIDQDIVVSLHSDTPVGVPSPLLEVWTAVNRIGFSSGKVHAPFERVDVERAMKMVTIDAAYTLGVEDKIGTIEAGKLADFTVLSEDPMDVDPMKIRDIAVEATILRGNVTLTAETRTPPK